MDFIEKTIMFQPHFHILHSDPTKGAGQLTHSDSDSADTALQHIHCSMVALNEVSDTITQSDVMFIERTIKQISYFDYIFTSITLALSEQLDNSLTVIQIAQTQHYSISTARWLRFMG